MYASHFNYHPKERQTILNYTPDLSKLNQFETTGQIAGGSCKVIQTFMSKDENEQREFLQNNQDIENLFRTLLGIVEKIYSDSDLTYWALCLLNGIIEDARTRIKNLDHIQKNNVQGSQNHKDCI